MIVNERSYRNWIEAQGVGAKDRTASSPDSYVSYLNSVSSILSRDISPNLLNSGDDVLRIARMLEGKRAPTTLRNYKSAMRQYVAMVIAEAHGQDHTSPKRKATISKKLGNVGWDLQIATAHNLYSSYREMCLEHLFSGEILRHLWLNGNSRVEILKPQVDDAGHDLVLEANGVVRHIQLKASHAGASTSDVKVSLSLREKPSGCVVWIWFDP